MNAAYQILSDPQKRAQYDQFGAAAFEQGGAGFGQGFGGFGGQGIQFDFGDLGDLGDVFGNLFGGGRTQKARAARGQDIEVDVALEFSDMVFGATKEVALRKLDACSDCRGTGAKGGEMRTCNDCGGQGVRRVGRRTPLGIMQTTMACDSCDGRGASPKTRCTACQGTGVVKRDTTIEVKIPAGIGDGEVIRARGRGEAAPYGGHAGDLYLRLFVKPHKTIRRDERVLRSTTDIGFTQAALGADIDVATVDAVVTIAIPAGTQSGDELRMKGRGIAFEGGRGDHIVTVRVRTPKKLSHKQKQLLEELDDRL